MRWTIKQLEALTAKTIKFEETIELQDLVKARDDVNAISPIKIVGSANVSKEAIVFDININCDIGLSCALTLEKVLYPLKITTREKFVYEEHHVEEDEILISADGLNLAPVIWQNIIVNIPTRVISKNAQHMQKSGENWMLQTEDEYYEQLENEIDPRMAVLQNFFKDKE